MRTPPAASPSPDEQKNIRLTITVTPEVHEAFQRLAKASSTSLGRAMGDWLGDTIQGAEYLAAQLERARAAPKVVMQEMHAYAQGLSDETGHLLERIREKGTADRAALARDVRVGQPSPGKTPPSNTGVTFTKNKPKGGTDGHR